MAITKKVQKEKTLVTFSLPTSAFPNAKTVKVVGEFNNWQWNDGLVMNEKNRELLANLTVPADTKEVKFRYLADNKIWENDWKADRYEFCEFSGVENSVLELNNIIAKKTSATKVKPSVKATTKVATKATATKTKATATKATAAKTKVTATKATTKVKATTKAKAAVTPTKVVKTASKAKVVKEPSLKTLDGIGPKFCTFLNNAGIVTINDLATSSKAAVQAVIDNAGSSYKKLNAEVLILAAKNKK